MSRRDHVSSPESVLRILAADPDNLHFSVWKGINRIVRVDSDYKEIVIAKFKKGTALNLIDEGFMRFDGYYYLTEKGKQECLKLKEISDVGKLP